MPKQKNKKCKAITNSGKKCDKEAYQNTNYCKAHQNKIKLEKISTNIETKIWYKSKNFRVTVVVFILSSALALYLYTKGPSLKNQETIIQKQDVTERKLDTLNYSILKLNEYFKKPKNQDDYEIEKRKFEEKNRKLNELMKKLENKSQITSDSLSVLKKQFFNYKKELENELAQLKLSLKEIRKVNDLNFKEIFKYGYTTFTIDAEKKLSIVEEFQGTEKRLNVDWSNMDLSIDKKSITVKGGSIKLIEPRAQFNGNTFVFPRNFDDIGKFYQMPFFNVGEFSVVYNVLTDNSKGITFIIGFVPYIDKNKKQKTSSV